MLQMRYEPRAAKASVRSRPQVKTGGSYVMPTVRLAPSLRTVLALMLAASATAQAQSPAQAPAAPPIAEAEQADVLKIDPPRPEWFYVRGSWGSGGTRIFDAKTGKMRGLVSTSRDSDLALDPANRYYYVSETIWSKGNRGTRQDLVSIYDTTEMKLQSEIAMPGRILIGGLLTNFITSTDGKLGFVYNFSPASSVNMIDLVKRKFVRAIELPGCASLIPNPVGFSALCSDGSLATVTVASAKPQITRTAPFFSATNDPIFSNFAYDKAKQEAVFLTYTGLVYTAKIGPTPEVSKPFSIQELAGVRVGDSKPLDVNWLPGGNQPMALHRASGHLFVLMHPGEYWSHKAAGTEIWEIDVAAHKLIKRHPLEKPAQNIAVTQGPDPMLFVNDEEGTGFILDTATYEQKFKIEKAGGGNVVTADPA
jgi:methylamine dehydrogenase heavy chain